MCALGSSPPRGEIIFHCLIRKEKEELLRRRCKKGVRVACVHIVQGRESHIRVICYGVESAPTGENIRRTESALMPPGSGVKCPSPAQASDFKDINAAAAAGVYFIMLAGPN